MTAVTSRRAILAAAASLPALSLPAVAELNDAELVALGKKLEAAWNATEAYLASDGGSEAKWERLYDECWKIFRKILKTPAHRRRNGGEGEIAKIRGYGRGPRRSGRCCCRFLAIAAN